MIILSFSLFLLLFILIGILSVIRNRHTSVDYLLAGHSVKPWLVALSAIATTNSGYMFIGMIGYTYMVGLSSIWLMIGWIGGDFLASLFIHKRLRVTTEQQKVLSFAGAISSWGGRNYRVLRAICGVMTVVFLGTYAAAQLSAGSKALHVLFGWDYTVGAVIGAVIVLLYCFAGGIRASIWTDAAQSFVMFAAMAMLLVVSVMEMGGIHGFVGSLYQVSDNYMNLFPQNSQFGDIGGPILFVIGWVFGGIAVVGQPHIMVRFMAMDDPKHMSRVRCYYYGWYTTFYALTIGAAFSARLILPDANAFDAELALPMLAGQLLPEVLVGLVLAGLFAATMSTADSQILSCSAAITRDFSTKDKVSYLFTKLATVFVTLVALGIALFGSKNVFDLVLVSWSALGSAFGPLLVVYAFGGRPSERTAVLMLLTGLGTVLLWRQLGLSDAVYEVAPGILSGLAVYAIAWSVTRLLRAEAR